MQQNNSSRNIFTTAENAKGKPCPVSKPKFLNRALTKDRLHNCWKC